MARSQLRHTVKDEAGNVIANALVNVFEVDTVTPVGDLYAAASGGAAITTLTSDAQGQVVGYLDVPRRVDLQVTDNADAAYYPSTPTSLLSWTAFTETVEVLAGGAYLAETFSTVATVTALSAEVDAEVAARVAADAAINAELDTVTDTGIVAAAAGAAGLVLTTQGDGTVAGESATIVAVGRVALAANAATIEFQNIPATYASLRLVLKARTSKATGTAESIAIHFNGESADTNYDRQAVRAFGTTISADEEIGSGTAGAVKDIAVVPISLSAASRFGMASIDIPFYAATDAHKVAIGRSFRPRGTTTGTFMIDWHSVCWSSTAAINRITLTPRDGSNFLAGSEAVLYADVVPLV